MAQPASGTLKHLKKPLLSQNRLRDTAILHDGSATLQKPNTNTGTQRSILNGSSKIIDNVVDFGVPLYGLYAAITKVWNLNKWYKSSTSSKETQDGSPHHSRSFGRLPRSRMPAANRSRSTFYDSSCQRIVLLAMLAVVLTRLPLPSKLIACAWPLPYESHAAYSSPTLSLVLPLVLPLGRARAQAWFHRAVRAGCR